MTCLFCTLNTMAADDLATKGARASAAMILTLFSHHLNRQGTNRLASNLKLVKKTNVKDVTKSKQMPRKPNNPKLQSSQTRNGPGYRSPGQRPPDTRPHSRSSHEVNTRTTDDREWITVNSRNRWSRQPTVNPRNSTPVPGNIPDRNDGYACFNCGENNHNVDTCRWGGPVTCHLCRRTGHKQKYCPNYHVPVENYY